VKRAVALCDSVPTSADEQAENDHADRLHHRAVARMTAAISPNSISAKYSGERNFTANAPAPAQMPR
jgi:hypothetical protein